MMIKKIYIPLTLVPLFLLLAPGACSEEENLYKDWFMAEVLGQGMDCGDTYLIRFRMEDQEEVMEILGLENPGFFPVYYAQNLPDEYKNQGLQVRINFRLPTSDEAMACTAMGPGYGHIWIEDIESIEE